jgi:plastocyanin
MKTSFIIMGMLLAVMLLAVPLACSGTATTVFRTVTVASSPRTIVVTTYPPTSPPKIGEVVIVIGGGYADAVVFVYPGEAFMWINEDHEAHTVTSDSNPPAFDFTLNPGQSAEFSVSAEGQYAYHDRLHPDEKATIVAMAD